MELHVSLGRRGRWSHDLYEQLRSAILDGRLRAGDSLPATRDLALRLEVSRNTVMNAYERLIAGGFLEAKVGAGTFVCATAPSHHDTHEEGSSLRNSSHHATRADAPSH